MNTDHSKPFWASIDLAIDKSKLALKVINKQNIRPPDGIVWRADVEKRLRFCYGPTFTLQVRAEADVRIVSLVIRLGSLLQVVAPESPGRPVSKPF